MSLRGPWVPWAAVGISLAFRIVYFLQIRGNPYFDVPIMDEGYHDLWAREIASGAWAAQVPFFRAPLYPVLLGLAYRWLGADPAPFALVRGAQLLLGAVTPWLTHRIAVRLFPGRPAVAGLAALIVALDGMLLYFEADLLLESILAPLGALFVLWMLRAVDTGGVRHWAAAGLVMGLFAITRPNVLLFAPILFVAALRSARGRPRGRWTPAVALTLATCLCVLPVTWVNVRVGGDRVLIASQAGLNFFLGNNEEANGWSATAPSLMSIDWWGGYQDAVRIAEEARGRSLLPSEVSRYWFERSFDWWRRHPQRGLVLTARKIVYFFSGTEFTNNRNISLFFREFAPVAYPALFLYMAIVPFALLGAVSLWRAGPPGGRLVMVYLGVYAISIILFFVTARYRVPLRPVLAILAAEGVRALVVLFRAQPRRAFAAAALLLSFAVAVNANPWVSGHRPSPAQFYHSVANVLYKRGEVEPALAWQLRAVADDPTYPKVNLNLGTQLMALGRTREAAEAFARERILDPADPENLASLGRALLRLGRTAEADEAFDAAERRGLADPPSLYNHAVCLERLDRAQEAEALYARVVEMDPGFVDAWNNLGVLRARAGRLQEALAVWEQALERHPGETRILDNVRRARERLGDSSTGGQVGE